MSDPCPYDPRELAGAPIGMFHCPECGEMVLAGCPHPDYANLEIMLYEEERHTETTDDRF
jgi:hypothetical protein